MRRWQIGQLFIAGFDGTEVSYELRTLLREEQLGGVILFARNITSLDQLCALTTQLREAAGRPILIGVDHEGGSVRRLPLPFTKVPPMVRVGRRMHADPSSTVAYDVGRLMGRELVAAGINCNFAPVLDINTNPMNPIIGDRAFGAERDLVSRCGLEVMRGLAAGGVIACGKHFPGHGDTPEDSHHALPVLPQTWERLRWMELVPFGEAIAARVPMLMTGHILYGAIDPVYPVTLSRRAITALLRDELGYQGVIVTDDLQMGAITRTYTPEDAAVRALAAGCDCCLMCKDLSATRAAIQQVKKALDRGELSRTALEASAVRMVTLLASFDLTPTERPNRNVIGCAEHKRIVASENQSSVVSRRSPV